MMQDLVGIVRNEAEMQRALGAITGAEAPGGAGGGGRKPRVQSRDGTRRSTCRTCSRCRRRSPARRSSGKRVAAGSSARTIPTRIPSTASSTSSCARGPTDEMQVSRRPIPELPAELAADHRGEEMTTDPDLRRERVDASRRRGAERVPSTQPRSRCGAATRAADSWCRTPPRCPRGWSCSTRSTRFRPSRRTISRCAGTARRASAGRAPPR